MPSLPTLFVDLNMAQELRVTLQTASGELFKAVIHTDDGIAVVLVALTALVVAASRNGVRTGARHSGN